MLLFSEVVILLLFFFCSHPHYIPVYSVISFEDQLRHIFGPQPIILSFWVSGYLTWYWGTRFQDILNSDLIAGNPKYVCYNPICSTLLSKFMFSTAAF